MNTDFSTGSVLVIGDTMLDTYYLGGVKRISPEAPVPVVKVNRIQYTPGGAANVANNLRALGCRCYLIGAAGADENRDRLVSILNDLSIGHTLVESVNPTVTKIRIVGNHQQIARLDFENDTQRDTAAEKDIIDAFDSIVGGFHTVIISDYGKGICSEEVCRHIITECRKLNKPVIVDPKKHEWEKYRGATIITPNMKELSDACGREIVNSDEETSSAAEHLRAAYNAAYILVTRSEKGMTLAESGGTNHLKVQAKEVYDVSGA
ncbi:MAG TPA: PfkB family carbohydrate kinase, partial [Spirochaetota bacterium]|nr:PfkB family carbohydrate kinase [Spirochaetota bacterium]